MIYRNLLRTMLVSACLVWALAGNAAAGDPEFQDSRDQVIDALSRKPVKYRSFKPAGNVRSIVVMEKKKSSPAGGTVQVVGGAAPASQEAVYETKTIQVVDNQDVPTARLKIEFDYNSAALRRSAYPLLRELGNALISDTLRNSSLLVAGHTDSDGSDSYNLKLSLDRAESVRQYLAVHFNIPEFRLKIRGYGEAMPLRPNDGPANKQMNRRVEIQVN